MTTESVEQEIRSDGELVPEFLGDDAAEASDFSRDKYGGDSEKHARPRKGKRVLAIVGAVFAVLLLAVGGYALWFTKSLDAALAPDSDSINDLKDVLTSTVPDKPFYMLLLGSDSREGHPAYLENESGDNERSDVIMLMRVDMKGKKLTLLSIPRDTPHKREDGTYEKINEVYNYAGAAGTVKAVSELTGIDISHYAEVRISGMRAVVDLLGGVTVDVPVTMEYRTTRSRAHVQVKAGRQTLTGEEAEIFARARHNYKSDEEANRQDSVRQLLIAILNKTVDRPITEIPGIVLQEAQYVDTTLKSGDIIAMAMSFANAGDNLTIYTGTGPSAGAENPDANGLWMCFENPEGWKAVMDVVDAGEDPHGMDFSETSIPWPAATE